MVKNIKIRKGCKDIWNAFMVRKAKFCKYDIPYCPTTAVELPKEIVTWEEAKQIYKESLSSKKKDFLYDAFVCFYIDDYKFDSSRGIWHNPKSALKILKHFSGIITPDFSTYRDFPIPIKLYATYRMRALGKWAGDNGINVINNVRWGTKETYKYSFLGIPKRSIVAIGTVGGSPRKLENRVVFENGLFKMVEVLKPRTIIVYGSANYPCFKLLENQGIKIISFPSKTSKVYKEKTKESK